MLEHKIPMVAVVGPTASGKTALSIEIAKQNNGEIVSFDSMQIYKDAPIATAIPTAEERQGVPHHLMSFLSANEQFSVAKYTELAHQVIADITTRGKLPVLVGGTGLYFSALLDNLHFSNEQGDKLKIRQKLQKRLEQQGIEVLFRELVAIDPVAASKIHINNHVRVLRALEVYYSTGSTLSHQVEQSHLLPSPYKACVIGLTYRERALLYDRINQRVHNMVEDGILDEIEKIYRRTPNGTLMQAIGIKEFLPYFNGTVSLETAIADVQKSTRHYAKRQMTWFRRDQRVNWLYCDDYAERNQLFQAAQLLINKFNDEVISIEEKH